MGRISTHVLDTAAGRPAAGVRITARRVQPEATVREAVTNADGRTDAPLFDGEDLIAGIYEIAFGIGDYFGGGFYDDVTVRVRIEDADGHYHVPLLASPWSYSTYRGS